MGRDFVTTSNRWTAPDVSPRTGVSGGPPVRGFSASLRLCGRTPVGWQWSVAEMGGGWQNGDGARPVRKRLKFTFAGLLVVLIGAGILAFLHDNEPRYEGKRLSTWMKGFWPRAGLGFVMPLSEEPEYVKAVEALRSVGTNATPTLLKMLRASDPPWKVKLMGLANRQKFIPIRFESAAEQNVLASMAFREFEGASNAVPDLIQIYHENHSEFSQHSVVSVLGSIGPAAELAVPSLIPAAVHGNGSIRGNAIAALGGIHARPDLVIPVLTNALLDPDLMIRSAAASGLGQFGGQARSAIPALVELLKYNDENGSRAAAGALEQIDPEAAAEALKAYRARWE